MAVPLARGELRNLFVESPHRFDRTRKGTTLAGALRLALSCGLSAESREPVEVFEVRTRIDERHALVLRGDVRELTRQLAKLLRAAHPTVHVGP